MICKNLYKSYLLYNYLISDKDTYFMNMVVKVYEFFEKWQSLSQIWADFGLKLKIK